LIERAPGVVSRDDILDAVWGHQALSESSIAQVIREIRAALGDSARSPTHIATRYGRGYQFVADVEVEGEGETDAEPSPSATAPRMIGPIAATLVVVVALVAAALQWMDVRPGASANDQPIVLRAVQAGSGESLSRPFVDYLAFVLGRTMGADRVNVLDAGEEPSAGASGRVVEISLAALEHGDRRWFELALGRPALNDPEQRLRFDEASELVQGGFGEVLATLEEEIPLGSRIEAGLISSSGFAIETLLRGMAAQFAGDVGRASELFEAALAEDPEFEFARYELAIAVRRQGDYARALAILEPMAGRLGGDFWTHRLHNAMGIAYSRMERYDEALTALRRADSAAESPAARAGISTNIGLLERNVGDLERAEVTLNEAVRLAVRAESPRIEASARNSLASVLMRLDRSDDALDELRHARERFYETGNLRGYGAVLSRMARIHGARGERSEAESLLRLSLGVREQIGDEIGIADIQFRLARIHRIRGEFQAARSLARDALERARVLDDDSLLIDCYQALAALALADRRSDQAIAYGNEALRLAELTGREADRRAIRLGLLEADLAASAAESEIESRLDGLIREADAAGDRTVGVRARLLAAAIYQRLQRPSDTRRALDRAGELLGGKDLPLAHELGAARARLALERGDSVSAARALDALDRNNAPAHPRLMLRARLYAERGNLTGAIETANLARSSIGRWWRPTDQARLDRWTAAQDD
jgi:tetratricopeptide (TPR) repeat protein